MLEGADAAAIASAAKALADPVRLRILHHIAANACSSVCACHLPQVFGVSQPTMSHHLKKLQEAGFITREMRGRWAHYALREDALAPLAQFLGRMGAPTSLTPPGPPIGSRIP